MNYSQYMPPPMRRGNITLIMIVVFILLLVGVYYYGKVKGVTDSGSSILGRLFAESEPSKEEIDEKKRIEAIEKSQEDILQKLKQKNEDVSKIAFALDAKLALKAMGYKESPHLFFGGWWRVPLTADFDKFQRVIADYNVDKYDYLVQEIYKIADINLKEMVEYLFDDELSQLPSWAY